MKTFALLFALAGAAAPVLAEPGAIPEAFPDSRYQAMIARSPFALATPVAPPVVADKSFAEGWYLSGVSQFDGKNFVTIRSRDLSVQFSLHGDEPNDNGVRLQSVEWSPTFGKTTATVVKDGQFAKVEMLNSAELGAAAPAAGANPNPIARPMPVNPGARPPGGAYPQPGAAGARTVIPRPSGQPIVAPQANYPITTGAPTARPGQPGNAPAAVPSEGRRRIRMINSAPTQ